MLAWMCVAALFAPNGLRWFDLVYAGTTVLVVATLVTVGVLGVVTYRRSRDPLSEVGCDGSPAAASWRRCSASPGGICRS